jgi:hypothetical protein
MSMVRLKKGDVLEVPLPNGKKGFIQYIYPDKWGDLIGIYDYTIDWDEKVDVEKLKSKEFKFYPILTRINQGKQLSEQFKHLEKLQRLGYASEVFIQMASDPAHDYNWKIIDNIKIEDFAYPNFIWKEAGATAKNKITRWYLYDGKENIEIGKKLPNEYKHLEYQVSQPPEIIVELIMNNTTKNRNIDREMVKKGY